MNWFKKIRYKCPVCRFKEYIGDRHWDDQTYFQEVTLKEFQFDHDERAYVWRVFLQCPKCGCLHAKDLIGLNI